MTYLRAWPLAALMLATVLIVTLAYQVPLDWQVQIGKANQADHLYIRSFQPPEENPNLSFRWTTTESYLRFEGAGRLPEAHVIIDMQPGGRPASAQVQVWETDDNQLLGQVVVEPSQLHYEFVYRPQGHLLEGNLRLTIRVLNPFTDPGHPAGPLGVVVTQVHLTGGPANIRPVVPSLTVLAALLALLTTFYLSLARSGWSIWQAAVWGGGLALASGIALVGFRFHLVPALPILVMSALLAYPLLVMGLRTTSRWLRGRSITINWLDLRWLGLIFVVAFVVKAAGMNHPAFATSDHWFRVHQINRFWTQPAAFWQQYYSVSTGTTVTGQEGGSAVLGQWGIEVALPYSPLFYIFAAPLSLIWPAHNDPNLLIAINDLASWLEVSQIFLLYLIVQFFFRGSCTGRAGIIAAAIFGFYPLSFLLFSDGGYNTIFASWLTLLFLALLGDWLRRRETGQSSRWLVAWLVLTLAAALLAHTSTLLLLGALVTLTTIFLLISKSTRAEGKQLAWIGLGGLGLSLVLYYGWYIPGLITTTLPTFFSKLGSGIGQDNHLLGGQLLTGFWPQLWEHYRLWPFLLTLGLLAVGLFTLRRNHPQPDITTETVLDQPKAVAIRIFIAWLVIFGVFSLLDLKVNLLQKHMLFVAPLFCLSSGVMLSLGWEWAKNQRGSWVRWSVGATIVALLVFNLVQGVAAWYGRVYYLAYPPGSG